MSGYPDHAPFREGDLIDMRERELNPRRFSHLQTSQVSPESIIRVIDVDVDMTPMAKYIDWAEVSTKEEELRSLLLISRGLFNELSQRYGINTPPYTALIGKGAPKRPGGYEPTVGYIHTRRVRGRSITDIDAFSKDEMDGIDTVGASVADYYRDKFLADENCLTDLRPRQFMYGKTMGDDSPSFYLLDLDPIFSKIGDRRLEKPSIEKKLVTDVISQWIGLASMPGLELSSTKAAFDQLVTQMEDGGIFLENGATQSKCFIGGTALILANTLLIN